MDLNGGRSGVLSKAADFNRSFRVGIRASANLESHRNTDGFDDGSDDSGYRGWVGQQGAPFAALHQPADGAFEVEVDSIESQLFHHTGSLRHDLRL